MTKHKNREHEVMLFLQERYPEMRLWRQDTGQAYAKFSVKVCLQEYKRTKSITLAMKKLITITYGTVGFPDILCCYYGIMIGIEIKVGKDRQSEEQKTMERTINNCGGIYILLDDKSPIENQIQRIEAVKQWRNQNT